MWHKCKARGFVSPFGSLSYNVWALIYEKIETSTVNELLTLLIRLCAAAPQPDPGAPQEPAPGAQASLAFPSAAGTAPARPGPRAGPTTAVMIRTLFANRLPFPVQARPSV